MRSDVLEDGALRDGVESDEAARREVGEAVLDGCHELASSDAGERAEAEVEAELLVLEADEVEDGQHVFVVVAAQTAAELLQEDGHRFGGPQEQDRVHRGYVD